jgi:hypothetical protein
MFNIVNRIYSQLLKSNIFKTIFFTDIHSQSKHAHSFRRHRSSRLGFEQLKRIVHKRSTTWPKIGLSGDDGQPGPRGS